MLCKDCGAKIYSWQEYCRRCGADLFKRERRPVSEKHSLMTRFFTKFK
ncbi:MAG: hypothetical protein GX075_07175 [Firmicutes bacterium]|nr:hypothetical protein [Bacillota bacterium]